MGFQLEINCVLRSDVYDELIVGQTYDFTRSGTQPLVDDAPLWLVRHDWTAQAEISLLTQRVSQSSESEQLTGQFRVNHLYKGNEQIAMTRILTRMYAGISDPYIYLLSGSEEHNRSLATGELVRDSIQDEGFIHASPADQLDRVANKYYTKVVEPRVLIVDRTRIKAEVKWEPATGGLYPHIFGPLNMDAVVKVQTIALGDDGKFGIKVESV